MSPQAQSAAAPPHLPHRGPVTVTARNTPGPNPPALAQPHHCLSFPEGFRASLPPLPPASKAEYSQPSSLLVQPPAYFLPLGPRTRAGRPLRGKLAHRT